MLRRRVAPVGGHLAAAGGRVVRRRPRPASSISCGRDAEGEAEGAIAVVGIDPVVAGAQSHAGGDLDGFVAGAADLEEDAVLALERDLAVVQAARGVHDAEGADELLGRQGVDSILILRNAGFGGHPSLRHQFIR